MFAYLDLLDDNHDWSRMEYQLADMYPEPIRSPLHRPRPKRSIKMHWYFAADKALNQFCKEWKNG